MAKVPGKKRGRHNAAPPATIPNPRRGAYVNIPREVPADPVEQLRAAAIACGMPEPGTGAYETWLDDVFHRSNLPPRSDGTTGGHISGAAFDDDPDGTRARLALMFASRRWTERASYTGLAGARAIASLLRFALAAMGVGVRNANLSQEEQERRLDSVCGVGRDAAKYLHEWSDSTAETDVARYVLKRAHERLRYWASNQPLCFPNCPADEDRLSDRRRGDSAIACILLGQLCAYEPHLTHGGATLDERNARANLAVQSIARELNSNREKFRDELMKAAALDRGAFRDFQTTNHRDKARESVARGIARCAFAGLYIANGVDESEARRRARKVLEGK